MPTTHVQVFAFEEPNVGDTLSAIAEQTATTPGEVVLEAWITRSEDESGRCSTWRSAKSAGVADLYEAPLGKLSARNEAHNSAATRGADVIVPWDADAPPLSDTTLSALVTAALRPGVALVNSRPVSKDGSILGVLVDAGARVEDKIRPHAHGQCHAFPSETWEQAGPFDTTIDQTNPMAVRDEEEFRFYRDAAALGDVVVPEDALVFNDPRRHYCYLPGMERSDYCVRIGEETF